MKEFVIGALFGITLNFVVMAIVVRKAFK